MDVSWRVMDARFGVGIGFGGLVATPGAGSHGEVGHRGGRDVDERWRAGVDLDTNPVGEQLGARGACPARLGREDSLSRPLGRRLPGRRLPVRRSVGGSHEG